MNEAAASAKAGVAFLYGKTVKMCIFRGTGMGFLSSGHLM